MRRLLSFLLLFPMFATAQTPVSNNFQINAPKAIDSRTHKLTGTVPITSIPYATTTEANTAIALDRRYEGLTVCIGAANNCTEYWYHGGTSNGNLVLKFAASDSTLFATRAWASGNFVGTQRFLDSIAAVRGSAGSSYSFGNGLLNASGTITLDTTGDKKAATNGSVARALSSYIPQPLWSNIQSKPSSFPPSAHTHVLGDLTQSGATTGQVPQWNGTSWAAATVSGGTSDTTTLPDNYYNVESFGAVPLDPSNPDAAPAADAAIQNTIQYALANATNKSPVIYFPNRYRLANDPAKMINGVQHYTMLYVPYVPQAVGNNYKTITFKGGSTANLEGQHVVNMPQSYNGSGLYCSWVETTSRGATVLSSEKSPTPNDIFGAFNYTKVVVDNMSVIVNTLSGGTDVKSYMSGIDLNIFTQCAVPYASVTTSSLGVNSVKPDSLTFGIRFPALNNHAVVSGGNVNARGFGMGVVLGEHMALNHVLAVGNNIGILNRYAYPAWISELDLEDNATQIYLEGNSHLTVGNLQCEDFNPVSGFGSKWFNFRYHVDATPGNESVSKLTIGGFMAHYAGGAPNYNFTPRSGLIDVNITKAESGLNLLALNFWNNGTRPSSLFRKGIEGWNTDAFGLDIWDGAAFHQISELGSQVFFRKFDDATKGTSPAGMKIGIGAINTSGYPLMIKDPAISGLTIWRDNSTGNTDANFGLLIDGASPSLKFYNLNTLTPVVSFIPAGGMVVGPNAPTTASALDVQSTTGFFYPPRMTAAQASALSPTAGACFFATTTNGTFTAVGLWYYDGSIWKQQ